MAAEQLTTTAGMNPVQIASAIAVGELDDYLAAAEAWGEAERRRRKRQPNRTKKYRKADA